jgi:hypothetical protein
MNQLQIQNKKFKKEKMIKSSERILNLKRIINSVIHLKMCQIIKKQNH